MIVADLKCNETTAGSSKVLKMSLRTCAGWSAQSLSTHPGTLSGPAASRAFTLLRVLRTHWDSGWALAFIAGVLHLLNSVRSCGLLSHSGGAAFNLLSPESLPPVFLIPSFSHTFCIIKKKKKSLHLHLQLQKLFITNKYTTIMLLWCCTGTKC